MKQIHIKGRSLVSLLILITIVLSACNAPTPQPPTNTPEPPTAQPSAAATLTPAPPDYSSVPIVGKTWYWLGSQFNNKTGVEIADPAAYSIQFMPEGVYSGKADCNNFSGAYTVEGANITLQPGIMTLAACPPGSQSDEFLKELATVASFLLKDGYLYLNMKSDIGAMQFSEQPLAPSPVPIYTDLPIMGKVWQWLRLDMSDGASTPVPNPPSYTLEFISDGTIQGQADCNTLGGVYTAQDSSLTIQASQLTKLACPPESLADTYVQRLNEVASYVLKDGLLYLNLKMDGGNMVFGEEPLAILPVPAAGKPSAQATVNVNARSGPGTNYPVYGVMPAGRIAEVIGKNDPSSPVGAWWALSSPVLPLGQAWVSGEYVTVSGVESTPVLPAPPVPPTAEFTGPKPNDPQVTALDAVYVRSGPGDVYPAYGVAQPGATGLVMGRSQDGLYWVVRINPALVSTGFGWVPATYTVAKNVTDAPVIQAPPQPPAASLTTPPAGTPTGVALTALNLRSGPGTSYPVLGVVAAGTVGEITGKSFDGAWWQVRVPNTISPDGFAWVSAGYVYTFNTGNVPVANPPSAATSTPTTSYAQPTFTHTVGTVVPYGKVLVGTTTDIVNVRAGPGSQYASYGVVDPGATGVIVGQNPDGTWLAFKISTSIAKDGKGWVSAAYVKITEVNAATATAMATPFSLSTQNTPVPGATSAPPVTTACKIISKKPADGTSYKPNFEFDMKVELQNTSTTDWDPNAVDVVFVSALSNITAHTSPDVFDLPELVAPKANITLYVDMKAPAQVGAYGETWALVKGGSTLCQWSVTFTVAK